MELVLLLVAFATILGGALLFTNAIEWAGNRLGLGEGAVGSLLAAVGTAMPETLIPIVAIIGGASGGDDVAIGAIVGAPFLLATIAMALVGIAALIYSSRRDQKRHLEVHVPTLDRDLLFFLGFFAFGLAMAWGPPPPLRIAAALVLACGYGFYVRLTLSDSGDVQGHESLDALRMDRRNRDEPPTALIVVQLVLGLGLMIGGAHLFVEELLSVAESIGVEALVLSLVLAPLATELPEKVNSFFWVREGKDTLALGNITGAMVFQSTIAIAFGLVLTDWSLDRYAAVSMALGLVGGIIAYWALRRKGEFSGWAIGAWLGLYGVFLAFVLLG